MSTTLLPDSLLQGGRYKILSVLGQGGFGITYLGIQSGLERRVAIKEFYMKDFCDRAAESSRVTIGTEGARQMVQRYRGKFVNEARKLARLNHPHIVRVIDVFEENDTAYYVMEYAEGGSLSTKVKHEGLLPESLVVRYGLEVASALAYIHGQRMNHLDIKPGNIMLNEKGETIVIDFGMSKHYDATTGNETSTTPVGISDGYAPMEQYRPGGVGEFSPQTDIYALGATLFFLLTGQRPPSAADINEDGLPVGHLTARGVSTQLIDVITKSMEPRKRDRYATATEFIAELEHCSAVASSTNEEITAVVLETNVEAERLAREEAARKEAERLAREEAARKEAERKARETKVVAAKPESSASSKSGSAKMWIGAGVFCALVVGGVVAFRYMGSGSTADAPSAPTEVQATPEVAPPAEEAALKQVENLQVTLDHGHATKRSFTYKGTVDANNIPQGTGEANYPKTASSSACAFKGTFVDGIPSEGDLVFTSGVTYHGVFDAEGLYSKGVYTDASGDYFEGTFKNGNPYNGKWYTKSGKFDGEIVNGKEEPRS